jgi:hypothetical protein
MHPIVAGGECRHAKGARQHIPGHPAQNRRMDPLNDARLEWQRAQADLQIAIGVLDKRVADTASLDEVAKAQEAVVRTRTAADLLLQRYITQLGKS